MVAERTPWLVKVREREREREREKYEGVNNSRMVIV